MTPTAVTPPAMNQASDKAAIRLFHVNVPEAELTELRRRIHGTRWPERETVPDATQGVQLATVQALGRYWATEYDWRKIEAKLNALPQFITEIGSTRGVPIASMIDGKIGTVTGKTQSMAQMFAGQQESFGLRAWHRRHTDAREQSRAYVIPSGV